MYRFFLSLLLLVCLTGTTFGQEPTVIDQFFRLPRPQNIEQYRVRSRMAIRATRANLVEDPRYFRMCKEMIEDSRTANFYRFVRTFEEQMVRAKKVTPTERAEAIVTYLKPVELTEKSDLALLKEVHGMASFLTPAQLDQLKVYDLRVRITKAPSTEFGKVVAELRDPKLLPLVPEGLGLELVRLDESRAMEVADALISRVTNAPAEDSARALVELTARHLKIMKHSDAEPGKPGFAKLNRSMYLVPNTQVGLGAKLAWMYWLAARESRSEAVKMGLHTIGTARKDSTDATRTQILARIGQTTREFDLPRDQYGLPMDRSTDAPEDQLTNIQKDASTRALVGLGVAAGIALLGGVFLLVKRRFALGA